MPGFGVDALFRIPHAVPNIYSVPAWPLQGMLTDPAALRRTHTKPKGRVELAPIGGRIGAGLRAKLASNYSRVIDLFKGADVDGDKSISLREFRQTVNDAGIHASEDEVAELFASMDVDASASISFAELNHILRKTAADAGLGAATETMKLATPA